MVHVPDREIQREYLDVVVGVSTTTDVPTKHTPLCILSLTAVHLSHSLVPS